MGWSSHPRHLCRHHMKILRILYQRQCHHQKIKQTCKLVEVVELADLLAIRVLRGPKMKCRDEGTKK